ncbi:putative G-protein coupled receptor 116 [Platysternon megacephalum]|uniref:Putative G-protein coupled receptor 116 n=1 Tax=Platysternon megacephalum TaxID=55544 RepID=A0A4D9EJW8_9SAUR|nr:putative G-protein coupled receptor 116 [Platysternon megacephalum]
MQPQPVTRIDTSWSSSYFPTSLLGTHSCVLSLPSACGLTPDWKWSVFIGLCSPSSSSIHLQCLIQQNSAYSEAHVSVCSHLAGESDQNVDTALGGSNQNHDF